MWLAPNHERQNLERNPVGAGGSPLRGCCITIKNKESEFALTRTIVRFRTESLSQKHFYTLPLSTIPMAKYLSIQEAMNKGSGKVSVRGWIHRERGSNKLKFVVLRDSSNLIQCVFERGKFDKGWEEIDHLQVEASLEITGQIKKDDRAPTGHEIQVESYALVGSSENFPIGKDQSIEFLADNRHLWLRSQKMIAILKIRSTVFNAIDEYFRKE